MPWNPDPPLGPEVIFNGLGIVEVEEFSNDRFLNPGEAAVVHVLASSLSVSDELQITGYVTLDATVTPPASAWAILSQRVIAPEAPSTPESFRMPTITREFRIRFGFRTIQAPLNPYDIVATLRTDGIALS